MTKKTIHCLVSPYFYPVRNIPSIEQSIDISHYLLTKHCVSVGGNFDHRYETIQSKEDVDRDAIFRLSYTKRLPTLIIESSLYGGLATHKESVSEIQTLFKAILSLPVPEQLVYMQYISSDNFMDDFDKWLESNSMKNNGYRYNYQKNNSVNDIHGKVKEWSKEGQELLSKPAQGMGDTTFFHKISTIYSILIESERPYVKNINFWEISGASSEMSPEDHQHIAPIRDRTDMVQHIGQIYKARKTWVIPYEVEIQN